MCTHPPAPPYLGGLLLIIIITVAIAIFHSWRLLGELISLVLLQVVATVQNVSVSVLLFIVEALRNHRHTVFAVNAAFIRSVAACPRNVSRCLPDAGRCNAAQVVSLLPNVCTTLVSTEAFGD